MFRAALCSLALAFWIAPSLVADELRTLGGKTIIGKLTAITPVEVTIATEAGSVVTPLPQVLSLDLRKTKEIPPSAKYTDVRLLDDSVLHCQSVAYQGNEIELTLLSGSVLKLPIQYVTWVLHEAHVPELRKKFEDILAEKSKRDRIVILRDSDLNPLEGTLGDIDAKGTTIQFKRDGADAIGVLFERLQGFIFYRTEVPVETPICRVLDTDGNVLVATKVALAGAEDLVLTTSFKTTATLKRSTLAKLDFNMGKLTYLSDMEPAKVIERSGIGLVTHYRKDANLDGEPILLDKQHTKGLSLHAHTELSYNLAGKYKDFKARLGIDGRTGNDSQARVTIYCDGAKRFTEVVAIGVYKDIALSVKDVNTLRIVVSGRNFLDLQDHATLADARVSQ